MSTPYHDCAVQTSSSRTALTLVVDDATEATYVQADTIAHNRGCMGATAAPCGCPQSAKLCLKSQGDPGKSSAARRHFAKYESHQLQEMSDEIELGWDCGICLETAEDPCVTRCGHLYCQSHLNYWLSTHPSCPVCKALCTPAEDVVPIFSRGRTSPLPSPISSSPGSPTPSDHVYRGIDAPSFTSESRSGSSTPFISGTDMTGADCIMSDYDITPFEQVPSTPPLPAPNSSDSRNRPHPHPLMTSYLLAHYLGIALRIIGVGILLGVLLR